MAYELEEAKLAILNAPFEERGWECALTATAKVCGGHSAHLLGLGGPALMPLNVMVGPAADFSKYLNNPDLHGAGNWRVGSTTVPLAIQHEPDYAAYRSLNPRATADYDDVASEMDIGFGCQSALMLSNESMIGLAILRGRRDGKCDADTLMRFSRLRHHLVRAVRVQIALDGEAAEILLGDLEAVQCATMLFDRHGCLCAITPAAERLLLDPGPLRLAGLRPHLRDPTHDVAFQRTLGRMISSDGAVGAVQRFQIASWKLYLARLPQRPHGLGFEPHLALSARLAG